MFLKRLLAMLALSAVIAMPAKAALIINEVDSDTENVPTGTTDPLEFLEIYDTSGTSVSLAGYTLVLYNGNGNRAYYVQDLDAYSTSATGYFVAGAVPGAQLAIPLNTIQNGADAVALYLANGTDFTTGASGTIAHTTNLVDAVVYKTGADVDGATLQSTLLLAGSPIVDEFGRDGLATTGALDSIGRIPNGSGVARDTTNWTYMTPTPGAANSPPVPEPATVVLFAIVGTALTAIRRRPAAK